MRKIKKSVLKTIFFQKKQITDKKYQQKFNKRLKNIIFKMITKKQWSNLIVLFSVNLLLKLKHI